MRLSKTNGDDEGTKKTEEGKGMETLGKNKMKERRIKSKQTSQKPETAIQIQRSVIHV